MHHSRSRATHIFRPWPTSVYAFPFLESAFYGSSENLFCFLLVTRACQFGVFGVSLRLNTECGRGFGHLDGKWSRECMPARLLNQCNVKHVWKENPSPTQEKISLLMQHVALFAHKPLSFCVFCESTFNNAEPKGLYLRTQSFDFRQLGSTRLQNHRQCMLRVKIRSS